jgi:hypothetical protein
MACIDQGQFGITFDLLGDLSLPRGKIGFPLLQHRQPCGLLRHTLDGQAFDVGYFAPVVLKRLKHQFDTRCMADKLIWSQANGVLLKALLTDLLQIFLGHYQASGGRATAIVRHEIRPGCVQMEANRARVHDLNAFDLGLKFVGA